MLDMLDPDDLTELAGQWREGGREGGRQAGRRREVEGEWEGDEGLGRGTEQEKNIILVRGKEKCGAMCTYMYMYM